MTPSEYRDKADRGEAQSGSGGTGEGGADAD